MFLKAKTKWTQLSPPETVDTQIITIPATTNVIQYKEGSIFVERKCTTQYKNRNPREKDERNLKPKYFSYNECEQFLARSKKDICKDLKNRC